MRKETEMRDVLNDHWTAKAKRPVSVAEVAILAQRFNRANKVRAWEKANRVVRGKKAFRQPGTKEAGEHAMLVRLREDFIADGLGVSRITFDMVVKLERRLR